MHYPKPSYKRLAAVTIGFAAAIATLVLMTGAVTADAGSPAEGQFVSYAPPSGPEMAPSGAADLALRFARESGENGEVTILLSRGTLIQARTLMEGGTVAAAGARESQLASNAPPATFCFGGQNAPCTAAEQQHAKEVLLAEGRASTYLAVVSGQAFHPAERLPRGAKPVGGGTMLLLIDAHTGVRLGMAVGGSTAAPKLSELQAPSRFVASANSGSAQAAGTRPPHPPLAHDGTIRGTVTQAAEVVVFRRRQVWARAHVRHGRFSATVYEGSYSIAARRSSGRYCPAKHIVIRRLETTLVHLGC